ncbi:MAG: hypothetical protein AAF460_04315 [Pseudomonadota bacterium]
MSVTTYRAALLWYAVLMTVLFAVFVRDVVAPHRQQIEIGAPVMPAAPGEHHARENRKFNDYALAYVPEVAEHMRAPRSGWLALWTDATEMGRPLYHLSAFSPAYPIAWVVAALTDSPWRFITAITLLFCGLGGLFIVLFARELGTDPAAALIGGVSFAASPMLMYWLSFPMFTAVWCWAAGALWGLARLHSRGDLVAWGALAFSGYSALMTGYPQPVVFKIYLLGGYALWLTATRAAIDARSAARFAAQGVSAVLVGAVLALPVYLDIAATAAASSRLQADTAFFVSVLPTLDGAEGVVRLLALTLFPEAYGNPISAQFPVVYNGHSLTALAAVFIVLAVFTSVRDTWGWWLAVLALLALAFIHPLYAFGVEHLGFHLSRTTPLGSILLPMTVILVFSVDAALRRSVAVGRAMAVAVGLVGLCLVGAVVYGHYAGWPTRWGFVVITCAVLAVLLPYRGRVHRVGLLVALVLTLTSTAFPLMIRQRPDTIAVRSPFVDAVRAALPAGSRYLVASPDMRFLPPNLNAGLGLPSLHSYNSLSARRYHAHIESLGGGVSSYGRWNAFVSPALGEPALWMSNVGLLLSTDPRDDPGLEPIGTQAGVHLHRVRDRMGEAIQVRVSGSDRDSTGLALGDPRGRAWWPVEKHVNLGDRVAFHVDTDGPTALVLSQKYHRDWRARALTTAGWQDAETVPVNEVFQGVLLAPGVKEVRLDFVPYARHAWIAHVFWSLMLVSAVVLRFCGARRAGAGTL